MSNYREEIAALENVCQENGSPWGAISPESAARMRLQNRFKTGLDIAKYTADVMRRDMAAWRKSQSGIIAGDLIDEMIDGGKQVKESYEELKEVVDIEKND